LSTYNLDPVDAASWRAELQTHRHSELEAMTQVELQTLVQKMVIAERLPRRSLHFQRHGYEFGAETEAAYERLFLDHIRRTDLRMFTFLSRVGDRKIWYLINEESGNIALYNETRSRHWSFLHNLEINRLLDEAHGYWVELVREDNRWKAQPW